MAKQNSQKAQILKELGLTESEFYERFPTQQAYEKFKRGGSTLPSWLYEARGKAIEKKKKGGMTYSQVTKDQQPGGVSKRKPAKPIPFQDPRTIYDFGGYIQPVLSGALTGAATGATLGPWGAVAGAAIGGAGAAIGEAGEQKAEKEFEAGQQKQEHEFSEFMRQYNTPEFFANGGVTKPVKTGKGKNSMTGPYLWKDSSGTTYHGPDVPIAGPVGKAWSDDGKYYKSVLDPKGKITGNVVPITPSEYRGMQGREFIGVERPGLNYKLLDPPAYNPIFEFGGMPPSNLIEVEGPELEVKGGRILKDFKGKKSHAHGGYTYDAKSGRVIIPANMREKYLRGGAIERSTIERTVVANQRKREQEELEGYREIFKKGGAMASYGPNTKGRGYAGGGEIPMYAQEGMLTGSLSPSFPGALRPERTEFFPSEPFVRPQAPLFPYISPQEQFSQQRQLDISPEGQLYRKHAAESNRLTGSAGSGPGSSPGSPDTPESPWQKYAATASTLLPVAFNLAGAFSPANIEKPIYNPYESQARDIMSKRKVDLDPLRRDIFSAQRAAMRPLGAESQGSYLSRVGQLAAGTQRALGDVGLKQQQIDAGFQGEFAGALERHGLGRLSSEQIARQQTLQNLYNKGQFLPKAAEELATIGRESQYIPMYRDIYKKKLLMQKDQQYAELIARNKKKGMGKKQAEDAAVDEIVFTQQTNPLNY